MSLLEGLARGVEVTGDGVNVAELIEADGKIALPTGVRRIGLGEPVGNVQALLEGLARGVEVTGGGTTSPSLTKLTEVVLPTELEDRPWRAGLATVQALLEGLARGRRGTMRRHDQSLSFCS